MIRTLAMIAVAGFLLATVCLSVAITLAGPEAVERGVWSWTDNDWNYSWRPGHGLSWSSHGDHQDASAAGASRNFPWPAGDKLQIDLPADVRFTQADGPAKLVMHGPQSALDHIVVNNGRIRFDEPSFDAEDITIELTAPKVTSFELSGSGKLDIRDYRQDSLSIRVSGDGEVTAKGAAKATELVISGSGDADLGSLATDGADVRISGSGHAKVGPKAWAKLDISGSGDVELTSHPKSLETHISGSGQVDQGDDGGAEPAAPTAAPTPAAKPART